MLPQLPGHPAPGRRPPFHRQPTTDTRPPAPLHRPPTTDNRQTFMSRKLTYDTWLFSTATFIVVVGLVMIYSASAMIATQRFGHGPYYFLTRQLAFLVPGALAMLFLMHVNPAVLQNRRVVYGALAVVALGLVLALFQTPVNGTHRWVQLPWVNLQPSEFAKPAIVIFMASFLSRREG